MAKKPMAKATGFIPPPAAAPEPAPVKRTEIDITPAVEATEALALRQQASALVITDAATHSAALEFIHGAKQLKRKVEDHWSAITRNVDELKRNLLNLKRKDLEPIDAAIATASHFALTYENAERRRVDAENDRLRVEAEAKAARDRQAELARLEKQALAAEAESKELSERERAFIAFYLARTDGAAPDDMAARAAAKAVGYQDSEFGVTLIKRPKIVAGIKAKLKAIAVREQQAATKEKPLDMTPIATVAADIGRAAGVATVTTYSFAGVDNVSKFHAAILNGTIPLDYVQPNQTKLNEQAKALKETFEQAFPGCRVAKNQGHRG